MRYKEISLNEASDVTAKDIVNVLMKEVELIYDNDYEVELLYDNDNEYVDLFWFAPEVDIELTLYNRYGYETLEIDLIFDRKVRTFYINTENLQDRDFIVAPKVKELFYTELKKLNELYKK